MKYALKILSLSVLAASPAYAQSTGPITTERLTITGPGSTGDVSGMTVAVPASRAVPVPLDLRASATKTIYDYGLARGATDITAALAEVRKATDNPVVYIPEGTFTASSPLDTDLYFKSGVSIVGAGRGRTVIRLAPTNGKWKRAVFGWSNVNDVSLRNLTIDANNIPADSVAGTDYAKALQTINVKNLLIDNVEIIRMKGDRFVGLESLKTQHARVTNSDFAFTDNPRGATGGILTDNSYFGADIVASITGTTMRVTTNGGRGAPEGLYVGMHLVGKGVPLNASIVRQISSTVFDASNNPIMGREGDYEISHATTLPANSKITGVANDDWVVRANTFHNCIVSFQATHAVSEGNLYNGWGSGSGIIYDYTAAGGKSINDRFRDGGMQPDGSYLSDENLIWGDALEVHGDFVQIINPDAENLAGSLVGGTSDNWRVTGGRVKQFAQASIHNTAITATTSGTSLTVSAVAAARGRVIRGQIITGPGIPAGTRIKSEDGGNAYTLSQSVTAAMTNSAFTVTAPIVGAAVNIQQATEQTASGPRIIGTSAGAKISGVDVIGSGTPGEKYAVVDQDSITGAGAIVSDLTISGVSVAPYKIVGKTVIVDPGARLSSAQLVSIAPNAGTALGVAGVGLTPAGVVSGSGSNAAMVFGDGTKFAATVVPAAPTAAWIEYTPVFTPTPALTSGTITLNRASYKVVGNVVSIQMRFSFPAGGGLPSYMSISAPPGVVLKDVGAGVFKNIGNGAGGFVHSNSSTTLQMDNKGALTDGSSVALSGTFEMQ